MRWGGSKSEMKLAVVANGTWDPLFQSFDVYIVYTLTFPCFNFLQRLGVVRSTKCREEHTLHT